MEFSTQKYWSGLSFPSPGDLLEPGIKLMSLASPAFAGRFFTTEPPGKPLSLCCCSVSKSCLTHYDPMNCSMPVFPVFHYLPESAQIHVYWDSDVIQPSHPLLCPFSCCPQSLLTSGSFPMSWLFASGGQPIGASAPASVLPINTQGWFLLGLTGWISLQSKGLSRVICNITVQKHQFFRSQLSSQSNSHIHTLLMEKPHPWPDRSLLAK